MRVLVAMKGKILWRYRDDNDGQILNTATKRDNWMNSEITIEENTRVRLLGGGIDYGRRIAKRDKPDVLPINVQLEHSASNISAPVWRV